MDMPFSTATPTFLHQLRPPCECQLNLAPLFQRMLAPWGKRLVRAGEKQSELCKCGNPAFWDFQEEWEGWKTGFSFSRLSTPRHLHRLVSRVFSSSARCCVGSDRSRCRSR